MKKCLLLIFFLGVASGRAHAQSSVTLYGALDTGLLYQSNGTDNRGKGFAEVDGGWFPSLWGLIGTEDIGGGYKIHFKLEGGFYTITGGLGNSNGNLFGRRAYVGADTPFGTLNAGLQPSPFYLSAVTEDPRGKSIFASGQDQYLLSSHGAGVFESNALVYTSPSFDGLSGSAEYAFGNVAGDFSAGSHVSVAVNFDNGVVSATAAYLQTKDATSGATGFRGENLGLGYTLGTVKVKLEYTKFKNPSSNAALTDINVYAAGARWIVTDALTLDAGVYASRDQHTTANKSMLYGAGAEYLLSKRTTLYTQVGVVDNKGEMNSALEQNAPSTLTGVKGTTVGADIGIRHTF